MRIRKISKVVYQNHFIVFSPNYIHSYKDPIDLISQSFKEKILSSNMIWCLAHKSIWSLIIYSTSGIAMSCHRTV